MQINKYEICAKTLNEFLYEMQSKYRVRFTVYSSPRELRATTDYLDMSEQSIKRIIITASDKFDIALMDARRTCIVERHTIHLSPNENVLLSRQTEKLFKKWRLIA